MPSLYVLTAVFGTLASILIFPQAFKIFKRKSARDISVLSYSVLLLAAVTWTWYGIRTLNWPLILTNSIGSVSLVLVIAGWIKYGR